MRVEEDVWNHPIFCEGHVLHGPELAQDSFLSVAAGKFVSDSGISGNPHSDASLLELPSATVVAAQPNVVHNANFLTPVQVEEQS